MLTSIPYLTFERLSVDQAYGLNFSGCRCRGGASSATAKNSHIVIHIILTFQGEGHNRCRDTIAAIWSVSTSLQTDHLITWQVQFLCSCLADQSVMWPLLYTDDTHDISPISELFALPQNPVSGHDDMVVLVLGCHHVVCGHPRFHCIHCLHSFQRYPANGGVMIGSVCSRNRPVTTDNYPSYGPALDTCNIACYCIEPRTVSWRL